MMKCVVPINKIHFSTKNSAYHHSSPYYTPGASKRYLLILNVDLSKTCVISCNIAKITHMPNCVSGCSMFLAFRIEMRSSTGATLKEYLEYNQHCDLLAYWLIIDFQDIIWGEVQALAFMYIHNSMQHQTQSRSISFL